MTQAEQNGMGRGRLAPACFMCAVLQKRLAGHLVHPERFPEKRSAKGVRPADSLCAGRRNERKKDDRNQESDRSGLSPLWNGG